MDAGRLSEKDLTGDHFPVQAGFSAGVPLASLEKVMDAPLSSPTPQSALGVSLRTAVLQESEKSSLDTTKRCSKGAEDDQRKPKVYCKTFQG